GFIGTELHKAVFVPLLEREAAAEVKCHASSKAPLRLGLLEKHFATHEHLLDAYSIADGYLVTVLNWSRATDVDLARWPAVHGYFQKQLTRPSIAKAFGEEFALYKEEQARKAS
ncbi:MAG: glutathione binding-like protein, partial [Steroidobacteraceae bacterium]